MTKRHPCGRQGAVAQQRIRVIPSESLGLASGLLQLARNGQALLAQRFHASGVSCRRRHALLTGRTQGSPQRSLTIGTGGRARDAQRRRKRRSAEALIISFLKIEGLGQLARFDPNSMGSYATMYGSDVKRIHGSSAFGMSGAWLRLR